RDWSSDVCSSDLIDELASGDLCMVYGFSGDVLIARERARQAGKPYEIDYYLPAGGAPAWFDTMAIPKGAAHVDEAHAFINYIETPQVHAAITINMFYPNANKAARQYVDPEVANNVMIYPPDEVAAQLFVIKALPLHVLRVQNRLWAKLRSGR